MYILLCFFFLILAHPYYKLNYLPKMGHRKATRHIHLAARCAMLCIAKQNLSISVNVVREGSPSLILRVRRISLGITIRPRSSTRRTIPVAVPGALLADGAAASLTDRGHSLTSLHLPPAALGSLPSCFHIYLSPFLQMFVGASIARPLLQFRTAVTDGQWPPLQ